MKKLAIACALLVAFASAANAKPVFNRHAKIVEYAVIGGVVGFVGSALLCGPAAAACAIGSRVLTTGGAILVGTSVGVVAGGVVGTVMP